MALWQAVCYKYTHSYLLGPDCWISTAHSHHASTCAYVELHVAIYIVKTNNLCMLRCVVSAGERRGVRSELDQLSCELKRCRYAMQKREIEVSKRELWRYAPKVTKNGRSPAIAGDLAALQYTAV